MPENSTNIERKTFDVQLCIKAADIQADGTFTGYGSVFGNVDSYGDIIEKGAFAKSLKDKTKTQKQQGRNGIGVPILWQHNTREPIGVYTKMKEDDTGLLVTGAINMDVQQGKEAYSLLKQGAINGLSIGAVVKEAAFDQKRNTRTILALDLYEVSLVTFPANDKAMVTTVKSKDSITTIRDFEQFLRDAGYSRKEATAIALHGFDHEQKQRDAALVELNETIKKTINILKG